MDHDARLCFLAGEVGSSHFALCAAIYCCRPGLFSMGELHPLAYFRSFSCETGRANPGDNRRRMVRHHLPASGLVAVRRPYHPVRLVMASVHSSFPRMGACRSWSALTHRIRAGTSCTRSREIRGKTAEPSHRTGWNGGRPCLGFPSRHPYGR
jgi:hypothetical protein